LGRIQEKRKIWKIITKRKNNMIGNILRHYSLLELIIEGYVDGKTERGRPRTEYMSQIMKDMDIGSYRDLK